MKILLYLFSFLLLVNCKVVNKHYQLSDRSICNFNDSISEGEKKIELDLELKKNIKKEKVILKDNDLTIISIYEHPSNKTIIKTILNKKDNIYTTLIFSDESNIMFSYFNYKFGNVLLGKEIDYNKEGIVIKTIDHEKGYKVCYAEAIEIVKQKLKNKLSKYDSVDFVLQRVDLNEHPEETPMWSVGIVPEPDDVIGETTYYKIDGVTGKYLGKYTLRMGK